MPTRRTTDEQQVLIQNEQQIKEPPLPGPKEVAKQQRKDRKELPPMASIYTKITDVMEKIERIPKNGYNDFHKYKFATESDITESVRPMLAEVGLAFYSNVLEQERQAEYTKVKMLFTLADIDSGEKLEFTFWGEGQDKGDKGLYKAYTGATKYFLKSVFLIPTGDDPEYDSKVDKQNEERAKQQKARQQVEQQLQQDQQQYRAGMTQPPQQQYNPNMTPPQAQPGQPGGPRIITYGQQKRMFARAEGDTPLVKRIIGEYGWTRTEQVTEDVYDEIVDKIDSIMAQRKAAAASGEPDYPDELQRY